MSEFTLFACKTHSCSVLRVCSSKVAVNPTISFKQANSMSQDLG